MIQLPRGLKIILNSVPLLNFPFKDNMEYLQHELPMNHLCYVYPVINEVVVLIIKSVRKNEML